MNFPKGAGASLLPKGELKGSLQNE